MLQRLPIALAQVKASNNSKKLLMKWRWSKFFILCINQKYAITSLSYYKYKKSILYKWTQKIMKLLNLMF